MYYIVNSDNVVIESTNDPTNAAEAQQQYPQHSLKFVENGELSMGLKKLIDGELVDYTPTKTTEDIRDDRISIFSRTIDMMNPVWYNSLDSTQQNNLATWRQQWLDYPSTGTIPNEALVQDIF